MERKFSKQQRAPSAPSECFMNSSQLGGDLAPSPYLPRTLPSYRYTL
jgi:hypothetical protein